MRIGLEVAQHGVSDRIGLFEAGGRLVVFAETAEHERGEVRRDVSAAAGPIFEFGKTCSRAVRLPGSAMRIAEVAEQA